MKFADDVRLRVLANNKKNFRIPCRKNWVILQNREIGKGINVRTDNRHICYMLRIGND